MGVMSWGSSLEKALSYISRPDPRILDPRILPRCTLVFKVGELLPNLPLDLQPDRNFFPYLFAIHFDGSHILERVSSYSHGHETAVSILLFHPPNPGIRFARSISWHLSLKPNFEDKSSIFHHYHIISISSFYPTRT